MSKHERNVRRNRAPRRVRTAHAPDRKTTRPRLESLLRTLPEPHPVADGPLPPTSLREQPAMRAFAQNLRMTRSHAELTRDELATRADIHAGVLCRVEEGRIDPPYSLIIRLAEALETSPTYLITQPILQDAITPKLRPPPQGTPRLKARATWEAIREEIRALYAAGEPHRIIALELGLTRMQLQAQLGRLFREGMPKR